MELPRDRPDCLDHGGHDSGDLGSPSDANAQLREFLASHGYVVATVPQPRPSAAELTLRGSPPEIDRLAPPNVPGANRGRRSASRKKHELAGEIVITEPQAGHVDAMSGRHPRWRSSGDPAEGLAIRSAGSSRNPLDSAAVASFNSPPFPPVNVRTESSSTTVPPGEPTDPASNSEAPLLDTTPLSHGSGARSSAGIRRVCQGQTPGPLTRGPPSSAATSASRTKVATHAVPWCSWRGRATVRPIRPSVYGTP
jgi:hypothetical protein